MTLAIVAAVFCQYQTAAEKLPAVVAVFVIVQVSPEEPPQTEPPVVSVCCNWVIVAQEQDDKSKNAIASISFFILKLACTSANGLVAEGPRRR